MQDKSLDQTERALLAMITETHARIGRVERDMLNVEARGRGLEVGRALITLKEAGLVEEYETSPGFFSRVFGARSRTLLRPLTPASAGTVPVASVPAPPAPEPVAPSAPLPQDAPEEERPVATPAPETVPVVAPEPEPEPVATSADVAEPEPTAPQQPEPQPVRQQHFAPDDYTDKVGGGEAVSVSLENVDSEVIEGLRDMLGGMGMELTMAGESLISDRLSRGESAGDALSQVVLFTFAHAVHYDLMSGGGMQALGLTDYAIEVMQELEKLRDAGAIDAGRFEADMRTLWSVVSEESGQVLRADRAADLLRDPIGGAAPPALLPDDIQQAEDPDDEE